MSKEWGRAVDLMFINVVQVLVLCTAFLKIFSAVQNNQVCTQLCTRFLPAVIHLYKYHFYLVGCVFLPIINRTNKDNNEINNLNIYNWSSI